MHSKEVDPVPMTTKGGKVKKSELPDTVKRSDAKAQRTFAKAHDSAVEEYGDGERSHRTAYSALKHTHEKVGDHWELKDGNGPSDKKAARGRGSNARTQEGVEANASKEHLYDVAKRLDISGRSSMSKSELVDAIKKENRSRTQKSG